MVLPVRSQGYMKKFFTYFKIISKEKKLPDHEYVQGKSLVMFLEVYKNIFINNQLVEKLNFTKCVDAIYHIFSQLQRPNTNPNSLYATNLVEVINFNLKIYNFELMLILIHKLIWRNA